VTLLLVALAMIVAAVLGIALGVVAVRRPGGLVDRGVTAYAALLSALPAFVWGLCLVLVVSLTLRWLPSFGYVSPFTHPRQGVESLVMPVLALSLPPMGVITRIVRVTLNESLQGDYIAFARSKGLSARRLVLVHALRGAAVPISAIIGTEFAYTLGDAVAVESVFGIPGVGNLLLNSFLQRDYPTIQGAVIVLTLVVVLVTTLSDLSAAKFDPRIRDAAMSPRTA
jgi:peptide/nickel transport system permease protein